MKCNVLRGTGSLARRDVPMPQKAREGDCGLLCDDGSYWTFPSAFGSVWFSSYRNDSGRGPASASAGQGAGGGAAWAGLRPAMGLPDFASKGERRDAYRCKEGPSVSGFHQGPVFRDPCSLGASFSSHFPYLVRTRPEDVSSTPSLSSLPCCGPSCPCQYAGAASP